MTLTKDQPGFIRPITSRLRRIQNKLKKIEFIEEDGVYKAVMGKKVWYLPSNDKHQYFWALNFMDTHERYIEFLQKGDIVIEVGAATGEYTIPAAIRSERKGKSMLLKLNL
ncbi:hypothetical protein KAR91_41755 [Candidatus Pacearchaeota archaeon]|nr:hypothetical protein [Candidatus Pacearchaeota archaeon]